MNTIITILTPALIAISSTFITYLINKYIKDQAARTVVNTALTNAIGAMAQAVYDKTKTTLIVNQEPFTLVKPEPTAAIITAGLHLVMDVGLNYLQTHARPEMAQLKLSEPVMLDKLNARIGLAKIGALNLAPPTTALPL
jgi:hypothetical protein